MKDFLFKGEYLLNLDLAKEAFFTTNKKTMTTQIVFFVLEILVGIRAFFDNELVLGTVCIMLGLFIFALFCKTFRAPQNQIKAIELKYHKDTLLSEINFTNDNIVVFDKESSGTLQFYYDQLKESFETKNLFVFVLGLPKTVLYISKDSIKGGSKEEFVKFIKGKIDENLKAKKKK